MTERPENQSAHLPEEETNEPATGRRFFMRTLAVDVAHGAASIVATAAALQRAASETAGEIIRQSAAGDEPDSTIGDAALRNGIPDPFRVENRRIRIVDQRFLPQRIAELEPSTPAELARAMRDRAIDGASALTQVAAFGLALAADGLRDAPSDVRYATLRATANALGEARPAVAAVHGALTRLLRTADAAGDDGTLVADGLQADAMAISSETTSAQAVLADAGREWLLRSEDRPLILLTIGLTGRLAGGRGTACAVVEAVAAAGRDVTVHVAESRPLLQGSRLTAWELSQARVPYVVEADTAACALLARQMVDGVLVTADAIASNGDIVATIGTYALAVVAQRHGVPFYVCATAPSVDLAAADGSHLKLENLPARMLLQLGGQPTAPKGTIAFAPGLDMTPAALITAFFTDQGVIRPPFEGGLPTGAEPGE